MKKFKCFVLFGIALLLSLVSCGNSDTSTNSLIVEDTYYTVFFDTAGGSTIDSQFVKEGEKVERPDNPVKKGYKFNYWLNDDKGYDFSSGLNSDIVLVADWTPLKYQLYLTSNLKEASTLIGTEKYYVDSEVTIESKTNPGYIFVGWYKGNTLISDKEKYTFDMWPEDLTYEARYTKSTNVQYKVKHYKISSYGTELVETEVFYGTTGTKLNTSDYVKEYENWHWHKLTSSYPLNGDGTTEVEVWYALDTYNIKLNTNNSQYGVTKLNESTYKSATKEYGTNNTIEAVHNPGYTFVGWYDENGLVSEDSKYTFTMPANDMVYEARFAPITNTSES